MCITCQGVHRAFAAGRRRPTSGLYRGAGGTMAGSLPRALEKLAFTVVRKAIWLAERVDRTRAPGAEDTPAAQLHPEIRALLTLQQLIMPKGAALYASPKTRRARARRDARIFSGPPAAVAAVSDL